MPLMLLQWQPILGRGTSMSIELPEETQDAMQRLNLLGNAAPCIATRFIAVSS